MEKPGNPGFFQSESVKSAAKLLKMSLTGNGEDYFASVRSTIQSLRAAGNRLHSERTTLTIGCTQGISVMILLPLYQRLKQLLDESIDLRILNGDYDMLPSLLPVGVDVYFECSTDRPDQHSERLFDEEVVPVASPLFFERFGRKLAEHSSHWTDVPRLAYTPAGAAWASWETWFTSENCQPPQAPIEMDDNALYLLEAAARGQGIALGWNGFVNDYFQTGRLVPIRDEWLRTKVGLYGVLTAAGERNPCARRFLTELVGLVRELRAGSEELKSIRERWASRQPEVALQQFHVPGRDGCTAI